MIAYLNELSLPELGSASEVQTTFSEFGQFYAKARELGLRDVKTRSTFLSHEFSRGYTFHHWLNSPNTDSDLRTLLVSVLTTSPFIDELFDTYQSTHNTILECYFKDQVCYGLGLASNTMFNTIVLSFNPTEWNESEYPVRVKSVFETSDELYDETIDATAKNISSLILVEHHSTFLENSLKYAIDNAETLWARKTELFPKLDFCDIVLDQIISFEGGPAFLQILHRLFILQHYTSIWDGGEVKPSDFETRVTPESDTRLKKFSVQLTVTCPDGINRLFSWHARFTPGAGRIHFMPLPEKKRLLIGRVSNQNTIK